ncbi:MAG: hypothetical protein ACTH5B_06065 [Marinomonas sp.]|uniref:hypothetical protein n=1 Tax=Marinomonas sp. TaxID=1904862 RepID=UPI003F9BB773
MANDAIIYLGIYEKVNDDISNLFVTFLTNKNLIPPVISLFLVGGGLYSLYLFYVLSLFVAIVKVVKYVPKNKAGFILLLLFSPISIAQSFGPNKEMTAYISMIFLLGNILSGHKKFLMASVFYALLTRAELLFVILFFKFIQGKKNKVLFALILFFSISMLIPFIPDRGEYFLNQSGLMSYLNHLDKRFLYFITFPLKAAMGLYVESLFGVTYRLGGVFIVISSCFFVFMTLRIIIRNNLTLKNDIYLISFIFLIVFSTGAFVQHRYLLPVYPFFVYLAICPSYKRVVNYL